MKYLGGKQRLGKHIAPILKDIWATYESLFATSLEAYLEPFCGSLVVLKNMSDVTGVPILANDYHPDLIQMWTEVKTGTFVCIVTRLMRLISIQLNTEELPKNTMCLTMRSFGI